jgi:hypothetical protein
MNLLRSATSILGMVPSSRETTNAPCGTKTVEMMNTRLVFGFGTMAGRDEPAVPFLVGMAIIIGIWYSPSDQKNARKMFVQHYGMVYAPSVTTRSFYWTDDWLLESLALLVLTPLRVMNPVQGRVIVIGSRRLAIVKYSISCSQLRLWWASLA